LNSRARLAWRCRRGTKELDYLLQDFLEHEYDWLSAAGKAAFEELLEAQDPVIIDWLWGNTELPSGELGMVVEKIRRRHKD
jgi:antitoxin CptB